MTNTILAAMIDSREPGWIQKLTFGGASTVIVRLETGDIEVATSDGCRLIIERKTPEDFLGSLKDDRLMIQVARLSEMRNETTWPYVVITGQFEHDAQGRIITERGITGWDFNAIQGALLNIQETGVYTIFCQGDGDFEACIKRLASRKRDQFYNILPARIPNVLGPGAGLLAALPGIGVEKVMEILRWAGTPGFALCGLTDLEVKAPLADSYRKKIRAILGLQDRQILDIWADHDGNTTIKVMEKIAS